MANAIYPKYKKSLLSGAANVSLTSETVKVSLIDDDGTANTDYSASHQFYSDLNNANSGVIATVTLSNVTVSDDAVVDADNVTFQSVANSANDAEALLFWIDTGNTETSHLVAWMDTNVTGLPITPDGSNIDITWSTSGIFKL